MKFRYVLMGLFIFFAKVSCAGNTENAKVVYVISAGNSASSLFYFTLDIPETSKPVCNTSNGTVGRYVVDTSTQLGKDVMNIITLAKNANLLVNVIGSDTCTLSTTSENAVYALVQ